MSLSKNQRVYLDYNATTPTISQLQGMWNALPNTEGTAALSELGRGLLKNSFRLDESLFANPSSIHWEGQRSKNLLRDIRETLAQGMGVSPLELVFTSGASESNHLVLSAALHTHLKGSNLGGVSYRNKVVVSAIEHPCILETLLFWQKEFGLRVEFIPVLTDGSLDLAAARSLIDEETFLVSVMAANNETGVLLSIDELRQMTHVKGALFHTDASQILTKAQLPSGLWNADYVSLSAHKAYGPKGIGFLYIRKKTPLFNFFHGGGQERGRRPGTENIFALAELRTTIPFWFDMELEQRSLSMKTQRDLFEREITKNLSGIHIVGQSQSRLSNTSCLCVDGVSGESLLMALDMRGFAISTGSACGSGKAEPSPVFKAMGFSDDQASQSVRLSWGWGVNLENTNQLIEAFVKSVERIREVGQKKTSSRVILAAAPGDEVGI